MASTLPRHAWTVFSIGCALALTGMLGTRIAEAKAWVVFWDNFHWTVGYLGAAVLGWLGWRGAPAEERTVRAWFALALVGSAVGQLAWDVQVATEWNPFPAPADIGYLMLGVFTAIGFAALLRGRLSPAERWAATLDAAMITVAMLTVTLALYLPQRGDRGFLVTAVLTAYPVSLLGAAGFGVITLLALHLRATAGNLTLIAMLVAIGLLWMEWNALTLAGTVVDGALVNYGFSFVMLGVGLGACAWNAAPDIHPEWARRCFLLMRLLPLVLVLTAALAIAFGRRLAPEAQAAADLGTVAVVLLAIARQSLLLRERDQLLAAERRLHASEQRFRQFAETIEDVFWLRDADSGRMIYVSPAFAAIWGCSPAELYADPLRFAESIHPEDRGRVLAAARSAVPPWEDRYRVVRPDGEVRWIRDRGFRMADPSGGPDAIAGIAEDVTAEVRAEEVLREQETRLREIVNSSSDAIFLVGCEPDGGFSIIDMNPAGAAGLGLGLERIVGRRTAEIFPPAVAAGFDGHYRDCLAQDAAIVYEEMVPSPQGAAWYSTALIPLRDARGRIHRIAGIARNVTAQHQAAAATLRLNAELERRVAERTAELAASNQELSSFAYSVSHDLRAPLRAIDGFSEVLLSDCAAKLDADGQRCLEKIRRATQRMGQLIDDLLALSRVTRGPLKRQRIDLGGLARSVIDDLRVQDPGRTVELELGSGLEAEADQGMTRIALENLLGNAWKFTRTRAAARISLTAERCDGELVFRIADNGVGFDMAYSDQLFTAFQRLHGEHEFEGTGIGLATVHRVVSRHGGRIWADSTVDGGASFFFTLPG